MFDSSRNPVNAYKKVGIETAVQEASPHQLIVLLFEGAKQAIILAQAHLKNGEIGEKGLAISKAIDIILNGLRVSLNTEEGGELAQNLYALYDYMGRRLLHANLNNDAAALMEVQELLSEIQGAWIAIGDEVSPQKISTDRSAGAPA